MQKLSNTVDQLGNPIEIWYSTNVSHTPCVSLILRVYAELIDKNWALSIIPFNSSNRVVWIQDQQQKVLAGIIYDYQSNYLNGNLIMSFTDPEYRGRGLNKICHECFEADCKKLGAKTLSSFVAVENISRIRSAEKVGMLPKFYRLHKDI